MQVLGADMQVLGADMQVLGAGMQVLGADMQVLGAGLAAGSLLLVRGPLQKGHALRGAQDLKGRGGGRKRKQVEGREVKAAQSSFVDLQDSSRKTVLHK